MTITKPHKLSLITLLAAAIAVPSIASADRDRDRARHDRGHHGMRWTQLGEVGTHVHDAEDYVPVRTNQRFEQLELRVDQNPVRVESVLVQFDNGRDYRVDVRQTLRPGQRVALDVPSYSPIKMLVIDYANRGPYYRAREDARIEVRGLTSSYDDRRWYDVRDRRTERPRFRTDRRYDDRFQLRGDVYIRLRG